MKVHVAVMMWHRKVNRCFQWNEGCTHSGWTVSDCYAWMSAYWKSWAKLSGTKPELVSIAEGVFSCVLNVRLAAVKMFDLAQLSTAPTKHSIKHKLLTALQDASAVRPAWPGDVWAGQRFTWLTMRWTMHQRSLHYSKMRPNYKCCHCPFVTSIGKTRALAVS